jgi:hypothetical protein
VTWWQYGAVVVAVGIIANIWDRMLTVIRSVESRMRHIENVAERQADTLDRIEDELRMARRDRRPLGDD